jgi:hypothetical protein
MHCRTSGYFGQVKILAEAHRSLAAATSAQICSSYDCVPPAAKSLIGIRFVRALLSAGLMCIPTLGRNRTIGVIVARLSAGQHSAWRAAFLAWPISDAEFEAFPSHAPTAINQSPADKQAARS